MSARAHPSATLLAQYGQGLCSAGLAFVIEAHLELCADCASGFPPLHALPPGAAAATNGAQTILAQSGLASLGGVTLAPWMSAGEGVGIAEVEGVSGLGESVRLLQASSGARLQLPEAVRVLVVVRGVLEVGASAYNGGDFLYSDEIKLHPPFTTGSTPLLCIVLCEIPV